MGENLLYLTERSDVKYIEESLEGDVGKKLYLEGITMQGNIKNANNRMYPTQIITKAMEEYWNKFYPSGRTLGELGHPTQNVHRINFENVSHKFIDYNIDGNNIYTKAVVLDTPYGKIVKNLHSEGVRLGISSRGFGPTSLQNGVSIVQKLHLVTPGDLENDQSAPDALMTAIWESKQWVWDNGELVEKDLSDDLEIYKKALKESHSKDINKLIVDIMKDYINKLRK